MHIHTCKFLKYALGIIFLCFLSCTLFVSSPTHAVGISKVADYKVNNGTGNTGWHSQGATMTKDYYIWTDWKKSNGPTYIVMCQRSNPSNCWRSKKYDYGHASTLYHRWGTDYFIVKAVKDVKACWSISQKKEVAKSKCSSLTSDIKIGTGITYTHSVAQGYTKYGDYYLRSYGNTPGANYVTLFDKDLKKIKDVKLPKSINEVEDVMVDGDTGIVYFSSVQYVNGKKRVQFYKIAEDTFKKWLKPGATSSSSSDSGSSSVSIISDTPYDPEAAGLTIRDETHVPEISESTYDGTVDTNLFGTIQDNDGCGVYTTLSFILNIMSIGVGIAAVIGIALSGITYLSAKSDVARTTKAKRRILEIVVGVAIYSVIYALLAFLVPEFNPELKECVPLTEEQKAALQAEREAKQAANSQQNSNKTTNSSSSSSSSSSSEATNSNIGQRIIDAGLTIAKKITSAKNPKFVYSNSNVSSTFAKAYRKNRKTNCALYVSWVLQEVGLFKSGQRIWLNRNVINGASANAIKKSNKFSISYPNKSIDWLYNHGKLVPGDIIGPADQRHTTIFRYKKDGKYYFLTAGHGGMSGGAYTYTKMTKNVLKGSRRVGVLIHPK